MLDGIHATTGRPLVSAGFDRRQRDRCSRSRGGNGIGQPCFAAQIVFVVAGVDVHGAVLDLEDARAERVEEVAVVGDEDDGAGEVADGFEQNFLGAQVEVVGRLVEQQEVRRADEDAGQRVAIAFAAGEHAERS